MGKYIFLSFLLHAGAFGFILVWSGGNLSSAVQEIFGGVSEDFPEEPPVILEKPIDESIEKSLKQNKDSFKISDQSKSSKIVKKPPAKKPLIKKPKVSKKNKIASNSAAAKGKKALKLQAAGKNKKNSLKKDSLADKAVSPNNYEVVYNSDMGEKEEQLDDELDLLKEEGVENNLVKFQNKPPGAAGVENSLQKNPEGVQEEKLKEGFKPEETSEEMPEETKESSQEFKDIENLSSESENLKDSKELSPLPGNPVPAYPEEARANKYEGSVFLLYFVDSAGLVDKIQLLKSSGHSILDNEALRTMARQKYESGQEGWYKHRVDFKLESVKTF